MEPLRAPGDTQDSSTQRIVVVGDSLAVGDSTAFTPAGLGRGSFVHAALGTDVVLVGGTAVPGATSLQQAARTTPAAADVLVLALGTNDLAWRLDFAQTADALEEIARVVDAPRVLVLAVPPLAPELQPTTAEFNRALRRLAASRGWEFLDAPAAVRVGDGWAPG